MKIHRHVIRFDILQQVRSSRAEWSGAPERCGSLSARGTGLSSMGSNRVLPAGTAAFTPVLTSGTITSVSGFLATAGSLMSDPDGSDADRLSSSALPCRVISMDTLTCTFIAIAARAFVEARD